MQESLVLIQSFYKIQKLSTSIHDNMEDTFEQISKELDKIKEIECNSPYDANIKGLIYQLAGKHLINKNPKLSLNTIKESISSFNIAIKLHENHFSNITLHEIYLNMGNSKNLAYSLKNLEKAKECASLSIEDYNNAISSKNKNIMYKTYIGISYAYYVLEEYNRGIDAATKAIDYFKGNNYQTYELASAYNNRGINYAALIKKDKNYYQKAYEDFELALNLLPTFSEAKINKDSLNNRVVLDLINSGQLDEAGKEINQLPITNDVLILIHNLANAYYSKNEPEKGLELLENCIKFDSFNSANLILYASILNSMESVDEKILTKLEAISIQDPLFASAQNLLGCIQFNKKNLSAAIFNLKKAVEHENDANQRNDYVKNLAICYYENGNDEEGIALLS